MNPSGDTMAAEPAWTITSARGRGRGVLLLLSPHTIPCVMYLDGEGFSAVYCLSSGSRGIRHLFASHFRDTCSATGTFCDFGSHLSPCICYRLVYVRKRQRTSKYFIPEGRRRAHAYQRDGSCGGNPGLKVPRKGRSAIAKLFTDDQYVWAKAATAAAQPHQPCDQAPSLSYRVLVHQQRYRVHLQQQQQSTMSTLVATTASPAAGSSPSCSAG